jgi:hypothetical protein
VLDHTLGELGVFDVRDDAVKIEAHGSFLVFVVDASCSTPPVAIRAIAAELPRRTEQTPLMDSVVLVVAIARLK